MAKGYDIIENWFTQKDWTPFEWQKNVWKAFLENRSGLLNAPTGSGKTLALFIPALIKWIDNHPETYPSKKKNGLQLLWVTPLRALAKDIEKAMQQVVNDMGIPWEVQRRTGDVSQSIKQKQKRNMPEVLIITPESLHILLAQKEYPRRFRNLNCVVVDEWHELIGSKRGTQTELALSRLRGLLPDLKTWGISATIGNMEEAFEVLLGVHPPGNAVMMRANHTKKITVKTVLPDNVETVSLARPSGHQFTSEGFANSGQKWLNPHFYEHPVAVRNMVSAAAGGQTGSCRHDCASSRITEPENTKLG